MCFISWAILIRWQETLGALLMPGDAEKDSEAGSGLDGKRSAQIS